MRPSIRLVAAAVAFFVLGAGGHNRVEFRSPLGIPLSLSGNFAEMRSNHFHSGLDIRTNGQTGYRVYAAEAGSVVRIAVQPGGYGHAVYLQHAGGYQTVYAHLDRFEEPLASYVKDTQYARNSFAVNLFPEAGRFRFAQGDVIAYSGNSGSSGGPHLHFEIRDSNTSEPLNPLRQGIGIQDETLPRAFRLKVYVPDPTGAAAIVAANGDTLGTAGFRDPSSTAVVADGQGGYKLDKGARIVARGRIGFGIQAHDYHDLSSSRLGLYQTRLHAGQTEVFRATMDRINFSTTRFINAHLDFAERSVNGRWLQRSHLLPGNRLDLYDAVRRGFIDVQPGDGIPMRYDLEDAAGNTTYVTFDVAGGEVAPPRMDAGQGYRIPYDRSDSFVMPDLIVRFPRGALYEDLEFEYASDDVPSGAFSRRHELHRASTPIHTAITVSISADDLPVRLRDKALLARVAGDRLVSAGGAWEGGFVTGQTRTFGSYAIAVDTVAPTIRPGNISNGASMSRASSIRIDVRDELSGIARYSGRIDGEWVLFEHDPKRNLIYYTFDGRVGSGRHELNINVVDGKGNEASYKTWFTR